MNVTVANKNVLCRETNVYPCLEEESTRHDENCMEREPFLPYASKVPNAKVHGEEPFVAALPAQPRIPRYISKLDQLPMWHSDATKIGKLFNTDSVFVKYVKDGCISLIYEQQLRHRGVHGYCLTIVDGHIVPSDGVGFVFADRVPCSKNIKRLWSVFVNRTGHIIKRMGNHMEREAQPHLPPLQLGISLNIVVDLDQYVACFQCVDSKGTVLGRAKIDLTSIAERVDASQGYLCAAVTKSGVVLRMRKYNVDILNLPEIPYHPDQFHKTRPFLRPISSGCTHRHGWYHTRYPPLKVTDCAPFGSDYRERDFANFDDTSSYFGEYAPSAASPFSVKSEDMERPFHQGNSYLDFTRFHAHHQRHPTHEHRFLGYPHAKVSPRSVLDDGGHHYPVPHSGYAYMYGSSEYDDNKELHESVCGGASHGEKSVMNTQEQSFSARSPLPLSLSRGHTWNPLPLDRSYTVYPSIGGHDSFLFDGLLEPQRFSRAATHRGETTTQRRSDECMMYFQRAFSGRHSQDTQSVGFSGTLHNTTPVPASTNNVQRSLLLEALQEWIQQGLIDRDQLREALDAGPPAPLPLKRTNTVATLSQSGEDKETSNSTVILEGTLTSACELTPADRAVSAPSGSRNPMTLT